MSRLWITSNELVAKSLACRDSTVWIDEGVEVNEDKNDKAAVSSLTWPAYGQKSLACRDSTVWIDEGVEVKRTRMTKAAVSSPGSRRMVGVVVR
ncbi:hypothetical protein HAX54_001271, partial [Datura stramonium]|nr:hypothetical protein [Datura stramonium]